MDFYNHSLINGSTKVESNSTSDGQPGEDGGVSRSVVFGLGWRVALLALYTTTTMSAVIGNVFVIIVFALGRRCKTDLTGFLINLAAADLIMALFCMPFTFTNTMLGDWKFGQPMCVLVLYMQTVSVTASVGTSTAIALDRYLAVIQPFRASSSRKLKPYRAIIAIWILAGSNQSLENDKLSVKADDTMTNLAIGYGSLSSVQLVVGRTRTIPLGDFDRASSEVKVEDSAAVLTVCTEDWPQPHEAVLHTTYTFFLLLVTYALPLTAIAIAYGHVCCRLWRHRVPGNADQVRDNLQLQSKRKIIKMLIIVVTLFGVCWLPLHLFAIIGDLSSLQEEAEHDQTIMNSLVTLYMAVHWLAMSNSFVNPFIYGFLNDGFRNELCWLFSKCFYNCRRRCPRPSSCCHEEQANMVFESYQTELGPFYASDDQQSGEAAETEEQKKTPYSQSSLKSRADRSRCTVRLVPVRRVGVAVEPHYRKENEPPQINCANRCSVRLSSSAGSSSSLCRIRSAPASEYQARLGGKVRQGKDGELGRDVVIQARNLEPPGELQRGLGRKGTSGASLLVVSSSSTLSSGGSSADRTVAVGPRRAILVDSASVSDRNLDGLFESERGSAGVE